MQIPTHTDIAEILLKLALNTNQSFNQWKNLPKKGHNSVRAWIELQVTVEQINDLLKVHALHNIETSKLPEWHGYWVIRCQRMHKLGPPPTIRKEFLSHNNKVIPL